MYYIIIRWFPEVQNFFYHGNKRKQIPFTQLDPFFESSAVLMTNLLRELALDSITEYQQVFCPPQVNRQLHCNDDNFVFRIRMSLVCFQAL